MSDDRDKMPGMSALDLERFWMRRRALSFDELCRTGLSRPRPAAR